MISLLMLGAIINYLTRSTLAVAAPTVMKDLEITTQQYSWIVGAFQGAIMLQPICGYVLDVIGLKLGFAIFAIAWSFISMAHGLAGSWTALFWLRGLLGLAEGSANPAGMKATSEWFPARRSAAWPAASSTSARRSARCSRRRSSPGRSSPTTGRPPSS